MLQSLKLLILITITIQITTSAPAPPISQAHMDFLATVAVYGSKENENLKSLAGRSVHEFVPVSDSMLCEHFFKNYVVEVCHAECGYKEEKKLLNESCGNMNTLSIQTIAKECCIKGKTYLL
ncbi:unnamed protein product [Caenorhabditis nigoni]